MFEAFTPISKFIEIARILARHDALFTLDYLKLSPGYMVFARLLSKKNVEGRPGQRLARALNEAGPSFIKFGQALSTRSDLLGEELAQDLSDLQDRIPPFSGADARKTIERELGGPIDGLFAEFNDIAVAAASIAQVHRATTHGGRNVAVKVLRPGIESAFQRDMGLFRWIARLVERTHPDLRRLKLVEMVETIAATVEVEMDLRLEAAACSELAENFKNDTDFIVPKVEWSLTARRVLTTSWVSGCGLNDRDTIIAAGHDPLIILEKASVASFRQIFRDGFFHADVHPGNIFVTEMGHIAPVDFGIMGRLDLETRKIVGELLLAFLNRDYRRAAEIHFKAGWIPANQSLDIFTQACRSIGEPILDRPQNEISIADLLGQLFQITKTFEMEAQPQLLLLQKTMLVAEGTARKLCPEANMWFLARPLIESWMVDNLGPHARIRFAITNLADAIERLPQVLDEIEQGVKMMSNGHIKLHPDTIRALNGENRSFQILPSIFAIILFLLLIVIAIKVF
jgi:ubiquinone biosynthesis protein